MAKAKKFKKGQQVQIERTPTNVLTGIIVKHEGGRDTHGTGETFWLVELTRHDKTTYQNWYLESRISPLPENQ